MGKEAVLLPGGWGLGPSVSCSSAPRAVIALLRLAAACLPGLLGAVGADSPPQTPRTAFESFGRKLSGYHCSPQICPWRLGTGQLPSFLVGGVVM